MSVGNKSSNLFILGWNSLERLPIDAEHADRKIYLFEGFANFLEKVFREKISNEKIQLNSPVKRVSIHEDEQYVDVEVMRTNQERIIYRADHVICTQSVGCLKQSMHQVFIPALPHAKRMCIQKLGFGTINKVCENHWDRIRRKNENICFRFI